MEKGDGHDGDDNKDDYDDNINVDAMNTGAPFSIQWRCRGGHEGGELQFKLETTKGQIFLYFSLFAFLFLILD